MPGRGGGRVAPGVLSGGPLAGAPAPAGSGGGGPRRALFHGKQRPGAGSRWGRAGGPWRPVGPAPSRGGPAPARPSRVGPVGVGVPLPALSWGLSSPLGLGWGVPRVGALAAPLRGLLVAGLGFGLGSRWRVSRGVGVAPAGASRGACPGGRPVGVGPLVGGPAGASRWGCPCAALPAFAPLLALSWGAALCLPLDGLCPALDRLFTRRGRAALPAFAPALTSLLPKRGLGASWHPVAHFFTRSLPGRARQARAKRNPKTGQGDAKRRQSRVKGRQIKNGPRPGQRGVKSVPRLGKGKENRGWVPRFLRLPLRLFMAALMRSRR